MRRLWMCLMFSLWPVCAPASIERLEDVAALKALLPGAQIKIRDTRTVIIFRAASNEVAECWVLRATQTLSALRQIGYRLDQISVGLSSAALTQQQCYDLPVR